MNAMSKPPSEGPLWDVFQRLEPPSQMVLRLKALIGAPVTRGAFIEVLRATGIRTPDGKAWSAISLNPLMDRLRSQGLLEDDLTVPDPLMHRMAIDAAGSRDARAFAAAIAQVLPARPVPQYSYMPRNTIEPNATLRLMCLAVYTNDAAAFAENSGLLDQALGQGAAVAQVTRAFGLEALEPDWVASRAGAIRAGLLGARIEALLLAGSSDDSTAPIIAHARAVRDRDGFASVNDTLIRLDLLCGITDRAARGEGGSTPFRAQAMRAAALFLQDRNAEALALFRDALKDLRKQAGKRKLFTSAEPGVLHFLALLRAGDAPALKEAQQGIDILTGPDAGSAYRGAYFAMQVLVWLAQGLDAKARELLAELRKSDSPEPLSGACIALAEYALDAELSRRNQALFAEDFDKFADMLPLVGRVYAEILARVAARPQRYQTWLDADPTAVRFTELIAARPPWERALESLGAFLGGGEAKPQAAVSARPAKRLAWFVDPSDRSVTAAEQAAKGRDGWTDGRAVAMKRLYQRDARLDYLTQQDLAALGAIRKEASSWYGDEEYYFDGPKAILALVGHPAVFDARQRASRIELVPYPLELLVTQTKGGYRIALSHTADQPDVFLEAETPTRYRVVEFPKKLMPVQEILGKKGLTVPASAREQVIAMVRRTNPTLPIRAELADVDLPGIEADATPVVQLVPVDGCLKVNLAVRPFGAEGPAYVAGIGGRSVLATINAAQVRANRDLPREQALRRALVEGCPTLAGGLAEGAHELLVEDTETGLELLLELRSYEGPVAVEWPSGKKMRVAPVDPGKFKIKVAQDRDWFSVEGSIALDDEQVLEMRFLLDRLDKATGRFVPLENGSFVALTQQMQAQLQKLAAVSEPHRNARRVHALGAAALDAVLDDAGDVKTDAAWKKHVARIRGASSHNPVVPSTLQAELRDYQVEGFAWMSRLAHWGAGACLADDMGLGKTVQAIAVMLSRAEEGPVLVVAPTSVCPNWGQEIARFAPTLTVHTFAGVADRAAVVAGLGAGDVLVCSYGLLGEYVTGREWNMIVLDEAQAIKNAETKRAQTVQSLRAGFRLALTGTPVENYLDELWSLFNFVNPGVLGSRESFGKRFAGPIERGRDPHARQALRALIRPFLLRRTKALVLSELPPRTEQTLNVEMGEAERAFYEAMRQRSLERISAMTGPKGSKKIQILAEITRLRRACCNPALIDAGAGIPSGKLAAFMELVEELIRNKHRALVFSQFVGHLDLVRAALDAAKIRYEYLDGSTPAPEREKRVASFQKGSADLFLISLRAGGTGLNLTAADYVVHLDPWWNPAVEDQASDRAHRIGQERPVTIYRLVMQDSIEERILAMHRDKRDLATDLLDGTETTARLDEDALMDLIRV
jgi:hypothetical protein